MDQQPFLKVKKHLHHESGAAFAGGRHKARSTFAVAGWLAVKPWMLALCWLAVSQSQLVHAAAGADPNAPWPEAERKGLAPKLKSPSTAQPQTPRSAAPASQPEAATDFRQVPVISGIVIVNSLKEFNPDGVPLKPGLSVPTNPLLRTAEFTRLVGTFLKQPLNETRMRELQREIILYYRRHDRPLVDVLYPEQDVSNGMLQVILIEGRLKEIKLQDKQGKPYTDGWSGADYLKKSIQLRTNEVISESRVLKDVDWLNRNPFRHAEAIYEPDRRDYGLTSLLLRVEEERQWSADLGYDDTGSRVTSDDRITAGATWGKAFGLTDHQLRYAFTFDPSFELLRVHSASYYLPLPWRDGLRLSGYYLDVKGDIDQNTTLTGTAYQLSARYEIPLPAIGKYQHEAALGLDFKNSENNLFFGQSAPFNTPTEVFQLAASYSSALPDAWGRTSFSLQAYYSPGDVTDLNTDEAFDKSHTGASAEYAYARFNLERTTRLPLDFTWILRGSAQVATGNLVPSEQLGLGGYATVRGYDERESSKDEGFFISTELRSPPFGLLHLIRKSSALNDQLQLLGFCDYGQNSNVTLTPGEEDNTELLSLGVGLRYGLTRHFSLRFDYGWQLKDTGAKDPYNARGHIGVVATY